MKGGILFVVGGFLTILLGGCASFPPKEAHPLEMTILNCQRDAAINMLESLGPDLWYPDLVQRGVHTACSSFEDELIAAQDDSVREKARSHYTGQFSASAVAVAENALYRSLLASERGTAFQDCMNEARAAMARAAQGGGTETLRALFTERAGQCFDQSFPPPAPPARLPNAGARRDAFIRQAVENQQIP